MKRKEELTLLEKLYFWEVIKGVMVTSRHLFSNVLGFCKYFSGISPSTPIATIQYPDETRTYPERYRGRHRLTLHEDGSVKCTSCFLCATACPARCIFIEPSEHDDPNVEKFPHRYEIDTLLCVYCGYCVDACPVDAIRMDSGIHPEIYSADPRSFIEDKEILMLRSAALRDRGDKAIMQEHLAEMKRLERPYFSSDKS